MTKMAILGLMIVVLAVLAFSPVYGGKVLGEGSQQQQKVLIGFAGPPGPAEEALVHQAGGSVKYAFEIVPVIAASVPEAAIDGLRKNPKIVYIEPDGVVQANVGPAKRTTETLVWGVDRIK